MAATRVKPQVSGPDEFSAPTGSEVEREYWLGFVYFGRGSDFSGVVEAAQQLVRVGRHAAALDMLSLYSRQSPDPAYAEAVANAFDGYIAAGSDDSENHLLKSWDFERLFATLDENVGALGVDRVTRIQWYFFPVLGYDPPTTTLHRRLSDEASFFVEIVSIVYRPKRDEDAQVAKPHDHDLWQNAYHLLESWSVPPGQDASGTFDADRCRAWIDEALRLLDAADRLVVGKLQIGSVLTYTPSGEEGWPSEAAADLIESLSDDDIDRGVGLKIRNRRGVTSRGITEGGQQERDLAADNRRRAQRFRETHRRIARILNRIADGYETEARENDAEAERRRRGLD
jgi:hypothetical protein